jgi:two-component system, OmpR family, sensor histidine kinase KdpD
VIKAIEHLLFLGPQDEQRWKRYVVDTLAAIVGALAITVIIFVLRLYPKIPNISFLYLLVVLTIASTRGLYSAIITSIIAFLSFDYFLVIPLYTFTVGKFDEWLALFIFLVTAIITGQLASALRQRAEVATQREMETRALYELVNATTSAEGLDRQLSIVAHAITDVFSSFGVRDCAILLPDEREKLTLRADACQPINAIELSVDEEKIAALVVEQGQTVDLYGDAFPLANNSRPMPHRFRRIIGGSQKTNHFVRIIPLRLGEKTVGVVRLLMENGSHHLSTERSTEMGKERLDSQAAFFWTFLDQATSVIERARLRREGLQVELLRRTDALRSALLSSVSHDLRTPLSSIKAAASSLLQEDVQWSEEERRSFAAAIVRESDRLNRLVGNLLDMSRIEGGALKPEKEWYPFDELVHDVLDHLQGLVQGRQVDTFIPDDLPPVELDYLQMDQVLTNLIENAVRYTPPQSPLEIQVEARDKQLHVSIADHGPGIPTSDLERIFDKFYRVLSTKRKGTSTMGTGLGLAVCRGLVEAHGGHIWAENREGGGAIFRFTLPLVQPLWERIVNE